MNILHNFLVLLKIDKEYKEDMKEAVKKYKKLIAESKRINEQVARIKSVQR